MAKKSRPGNLDVESVNLPGKNKPRQQSQLFGENCVSFVHKAPKWAASETRNRSPMRTFEAQQI